MSNKILSCDWGTSHFRLRLIHLPDLSVMAETIGGKGIAAIHHDWLRKGLPETARADYYKSILLAQLEKLRDHSMAGVPLIISGMASSSIGMMEIPYGEIPFLIKHGKLPVRRILPDSHFPQEIFLVSGLKTETDVMRGEETILAGCGVENSPEEKLFIFPGTHSKQVFVQNNMVKDFKTYMTGELFDLLGSKSILANSVEQNEPSPANQDTFISGVREAAGSNLLNIIFHVRTHQLFGTLSNQENYHYLSGLLIGEELKSIRDAYYSQIIVLSSGILADLYIKALSVLNLSAKISLQNADKAFIQGQADIFSHYQ